LANKTTKRSAEASLKGYHYQLDKAIVQLLENSSSTANVTIEGVEDIDVDDGLTYVAIQCKYLESETRTPSRIRGPVSLMLAEYKKNASRPWAFRLYAYFGTAIGPAPDFTLESIKSLLTYKSGKGADERIIRIHDDLDVSDAELIGFLKCFKYEEGLEFDRQRQLLIELLRTTFSVETAEAVDFYYPKALAVALEVATEPTVHDRTTTKAAFIKEIRNAASSVASPWLARLLGKEKALKFLQRVCRNAKLFASTKEKTLVIDGRGDDNGPVSISLPAFIQEVVNGSFVPKKSLYDAQPWTILVDLPEGEIKELKRELLVLDVLFNDGYEHVQFNLKVFNAPPVINRHMVASKKVTDKLGIASYRCRLASLSAVAPHLGELRLGNVLICIGSVEMQHRLKLHSRISANIGNQWARSDLLMLLK
jgi:hypothetical protein